MAGPPLSAGAVHERLIVVVPLAVAVRLVGAPGTAWIGAPNSWTVIVSFTPRFGEAFINHL